MSSKSLKNVIGDKEYTMSLKVSSFAHLCSFKEVSDFKYSVRKYDKKFDVFVDSDCKDYLTDDEYNLLTSMFATLVKEGIDSSSIYGALATLNTGNNFKWEYTKNQKRDFMPIFNRLNLTSSFTLVKKDYNGCYKEENLPSDEKGYLELTMFNLESDKISNVAEMYDDYVKKLESLLPKEEKKEEDDKVITEEMIREYLRQGT